MAGLLETGDRVEIADPALDVRMARLPVVRRGAGRGENRVGGEDAGRLYVDHEARARMLCGDVARQHHADLVGEDLVALVVHDAAAVAVAVETERDVCAGLQRLVAHGVEHEHVFGIGIVVRERVVELGVERHDLAAKPVQDLGRERTCRPVAAGRDDLEAARDRTARDQFVDIPAAESSTISRAPPSARSKAPASTIRFSSSISSGPKVTGRSHPIFTPVQPFSLCDAVTMAHGGQSSANCAK